MKSPTKLDTTELIFADYDCNDITVFQAMERADALIKESSSKAYESGFKEGKQAIEAYIAERETRAFHKGYSEGLDDAKYVTVEKRPIPSLKNVRIEGIDHLSKNGTE